MAFNDEDIAEVMTAEMGIFPPDQTRTTMPGQHYGRNERPEKAERHGVFHRPSFNTEFERQPRCPHLFEDGRQCTYTVAFCPGHRGKK